MRVFTRLWQRVLVYSFLLVIAAGVVGYCLLQRNLTDKASTVVITFTGELRNALAGQSEEEAARLLRRFNNQEARFWLEDEQGELIAGRRFDGRSGRDWAGSLQSGRNAGNVTLWKTNQESPLFLAAAPCSLRGKEAVLYAAYMAFPTPPLDTMLSPGIITLLLITGVLALWIALRVGAPLRRLQEEVGQVSASPDQLRHVTEAGSDEIADVSRAINRLVDSLKSHIDGMSELVINVSHEMRSPLTRMAFSMEMISEGLALCRRHGAELSGRDAEIARLAEANLASLRQELDYMNQLVGDTLFAGKLAVRDPGELNEVVSLSSICDSMADRFSPMFRQAGVRFIWNIGPDIRVTGDATLLTQVVSNLLENAEKYVCGEDLRVRFRLDTDGDFARVAVENTHAPLPPEALAHLFEPYFRYGQQTGTGVGLGLSIVKNTVVLHGGQVSVENTADGVRFLVALPLGPSDMPR